MENLNRSGIYYLKANNENLYYIGSTKNLRLRKNLHFSQIKLKDRKRGCIAMIEAKERGNEISFGVLEFTDNLLEKEQEWILKYHKDEAINLVNQFDAERTNSSITNSFKNKMSKIRNNSTINGKNIHVFSHTGNYIKSYWSGRDCASDLGLGKTAVIDAAKGKYQGRFKYKNYLIINNEVLYKLGELLELHQELRTISSQALEACKQSSEGSTTNE